MKIVAGLIAGLVLGFAGTAFAATSWESTGRTYSCSGSPISVFCTETNWQTNYKTAIYPGAIAVSYGQRLIFHCNRKQRPDGNCVYYGR